jgi:hypothetical protein
MDQPYIELPCLIEQFGIADKSLASLDKALRTRFAEHLLETGPQENLPIIFIDGLEQLLEIARPKMLRSQSEQLIHKLKTGLEMQGKKSPMASTFDK